MLIFTIASWIAALSAIFTYFATVRNPARLTWFNWANVLAGFVLVPYDIVLGALAPALLSATFGFVGAWGLWN